VCVCVCVRVCVSVCFGIANTTHMHTHAHTPPPVQALSFYKQWIIVDRASGQPLQGEELVECRKMTAAAARFLQFDPDGGNWQYNTESGESSLL